MRTAWNPLACWKTGTIVATGLVCSLAVPTALATEMSVADQNTLVPRHREASHNDRVGNDGLSLEGFGTRSVTPRLAATMVSMLTSGVLLETEQPAVPTDACSLVSEEEVSEVLGKSVVSQELMPLVCQYASEDSGTGGAEVLLVDATALGCTLAFQVGGLQGASSVDGFGAEARFKDGETPELAVCFDEAVMLKVVIRAETTDSLERAIQIARIAETRIR